MCLSAYRRGPQVGLSIIITIVYRTCVPLKPVLLFQHCSSVFAIQFLPLLDNNQALTVTDQQSSSTKNVFGQVKLTKRDVGQTNGTQVFNLMLCIDEAFFVELTSNPNFVLQGKTAGQPLTLGYRDPNGLYSGQLFILDPPFIRLI